MTVPRQITSTPRLIGCVLFALALTVCAFSPRFWLMRTYLKGTPQWDRAHTFLLQCEAPFRHDVEPAVLWRLLPPLVAYGVGLTGRTPLIIAPLGALALAIYAAVLLRRRQPDTEFVLGGTLLVTTSAAVLVPLHWLGLNDAWVWLGLLALAFGQSRWAIPVGCLLCPWVDERFIIGFPLAWTVRCLDRSEPLFNRQAWQALWLLPYVAIRVLVRRDPAIAEATSGFLALSLVMNFNLISLVPLGWWMGLRAGWVAVGAAGWLIPAERRWFAFAVTLGTLVVSWLLASDFSRSASIVLPVVLLGCFALLRRFPDHAPRIVLVLGIAALIIPAAHVSYKSIDPINPFPLEFVRLLRWI